MTVHLRHLAFVAWVIVLGAGLLACPPAIADTGAADPYVDQLAAAADTPTLGWADCDDGFLCATAEVPLNYNRPGDEQIELAVIKLPATDPQNRSGTLFIISGVPVSPALTGCADVRGGRGCSPRSCDRDSISSLGISEGCRAAPQCAAFPTRPNSGSFLCRVRGCPWMLAESRHSSLGQRSSPTAASSRPARS